MDEKDLPSSSDDSDADFVPKEEDYNSGSGSEVSDCASSGDENDENKSGKRKKSSKKDKKSIKKNKIEDNGKDDEKEETEEKSNIYVDALWADFKKDVNNKVPNETAESKEDCKTVNKNNTATEPELDAKKPIVDSELPPKSTSNFAARGRGGGLSNVLSQIGKKAKMSTLQKSQLDWNNFKKSQGIEEEIKMHNRGKDGYLEKQDFLQRTDLRQFEIEKDLRSARRKF